MTRGTIQQATGAVLAGVLGAASALSVSAQVPSNQVSPAQLPSTPAPPVQLPAGQAPQNESSIASQLDNAYTLGAGDIIRIDSFDTPELTLEPRYSVLLDGTVNLPWVGLVSVRNLTLEEAAREITQRYSRFIRTPVITVSLIAPRPLKIGIIGEVNRPGSYIISVISNESTLSGLTQRTNSAEGGSQWPTVSRAIQTAGGITQMASIRQVQVRRPQRSTGAEEVITVDLWRFLQEGDLTQDMLLRDGDTVIIPEATNISAAEATQVAVSNFSPENIRVNVVGEVVTPGAITIRPNSTLNQAILAAGGFRNNRADSDVTLIRLNPNGTVTNRRVSVDLAQNLNDDRNPALRNNDVVVVRRNTLGRITDVMTTFFPPFTSLFGIFNLFR